MYLHNVKEKRFNLFQKIYNLDIFVRLIYKSISIMKINPFVILRNHRQSKKIFKKKGRKPKTNLTPKTSP